MKILIVGGGLSGLALAETLEAQGVTICWLKRARALVDGL